MLALGRWSVAAALLAVFCWREIVAKRAHLRAEALHFLVLGALGMWVCGAFVYIGARSTTAVNIGLIYAGSPVLIALASAQWLHERFGARSGPAWCSRSAVSCTSSSAASGRPWPTCASTAATPGSRWR